MVNPNFKYTTLNQTNSSFHSAAARGLWKVNLQELGLQDGMWYYLCRKLLSVNRMILATNMNLVPIMKAIKLLKSLRNFYDNVPLINNLRISSCVSAI